MRPFAVEPCHHAHIRYHTIARILPSLRRSRPFPGSVKTVAKPSPIGNMVIREGAESCLNHETAVISKTSPP